MTSPTVHVTDEPSPDAEPAPAPSAAASATGDLEDRQVALATLRDLARS